MHCDLLLNLKTENIPHMHDLQPVICCIPLFAVGNSLLLDFRFAALAVYCLLLCAQLTKATNNLSFAVQLRLCTECASYVLATISTPFIGTEEPPCARGTARNRLSVSVLCLQNAEGNEEGSFHSMLECARKKIIQETKRWYTRTVYECIECSVMVTKIRQLLLMFLQS